MEVGRSLTGHGLTGINKTEPQEKGEGLRLVDNKRLSRQSKGSKADGSDE